MHMDDKEYIQRITESEFYGVKENYKNNENPRVVGTSHIGNLISIIKERENKKMELESKIILS